MGKRWMSRCTHPSAGVCSWISPLWEDRQFLLNQLQSFLSQTVLPFFLYSFPTTLEPVPVWLQVTADKSYLLFHNPEKESRSFILLIQSHDTFFLFNTYVLFPFLDSPQLCTTKLLRDTKRKKYPQLSQPTSCCVTDSTPQWHWWCLAWCEISTVHLPETDPGNWKLLTSGRG